MVRSSSRSKRVCYKCNRTGVLFENFQNSNIYVICGPCQQQEMLPTSSAQAGALPSSTTSASTPTSTTTPPGEACPFVQPPKSPVPRIPLSPTAANDSPTSGSPWPSTSPSTSSTSITTSTSSPNTARTPMERRAEGSQSAVSNARPRKRKLEQSQDEKLGVPGWDCFRCTFHNHDLMPVCEMCGLECRSEITTTTTSSSSSGAGHSPPLSAAPSHPSPAVAAAAVVAVAELGGAVQVGTPSWSVVSSSSPQDDVMEYKDQQRTEVESLVPGRDPTEPVKKPKSRWANFSIKNKTPPSASSPKTLEGRCATTTGSDTHVWDAREETARGEAKEVENLEEEQRETEEGSPHPKRPGTLQLPPSALTPRFQVTSPALTPDTAPAAAAHTWPATTSLDFTTAPFDRCTARVLAGGGEIWLVHVRRVAVNQSCLTTARPVPGVFSSSY